MTSHSLHPIQALRNGLIISCQAPVDSPLHDPLVIAAMAGASVNQGAVGIRIDTPAHVKAVRQQCPTIPIIGLWKQMLPGFEVYITPQFHHAEAIALAGADIIAIDA
ncbi:MAG TPA: acetylmannosamine-6-phosphate 2-epimerase, partial [Cyanophyceae cyanobacterium]